VLAASSSANNLSTILPSVGKIAGSIDAIKGPHFREKGMSGISARSFALTTGIFGSSSMFFITWWLILIVAAEGLATLFERLFIG